MIGLKCNTAIAGERDGKIKLHLVTTCPGNQ